VNCSSSGEVGTESPFSRSLLHWPIQLAAMTNTASSIGHHSQLCEMGQFFVWLPVHLRTRMFWVSASVMRFYMLDCELFVALQMLMLMGGVSKIQMRSFIVIFWRSLVILSVAKNLITCALYFCWHLQILHFVQNDRDRRYFDTPPRATFYLFFRLSLLNRPSSLMVSIGTASPLQ